jgi:hypothetical protein
MIYGQKRNATGASIACVQFIPVMLSCFPKKYTWKVLIFNLKIFRAIYPCIVGIGNLIYVMIHLEHQACVR